MERKDFLKITGALGLASMIPGAAHGATDDHADAPPQPLPGGGCTLIPTETAGPYPLDLSGNSAMFRQDITEGNAGIPLHLVLTIVDTNNGCVPVPNARVDIWHCNKDGYYSGYVNQGYLGTQNNVGATFFRGIQLTDSNGQVQFDTIYPGWYGGRVTHIHFQVFLSSTLNATSQMCFPEDITAIVDADDLYSAHGTDPLTNATDPGVFDSPSGAYLGQQLTLEATDQGYSGSLTVGIAVPVTGLNDLEPMTGGQFDLGQNFPNPYAGSTTIPFTLRAGGHVLIDLFDTQGRKVARLDRGELPAGEHRVPVDLSTLGLASANYVYQIQVSNARGVFRQCKLMTARR